MKTRIRKLQRLIADENIDALLVSELSHIRYLCGFSATETLDGMLVVLRDSAHLFTDFRYREQAAEQVTGARVHIVERQLIIDVCDFEPLGKLHLRIGFEGDFLTHGTLERLKSGIDKGIFIPTNDLVEELSIVKDRTELSRIKGAVKISDTAFERILGIIQPGVREDEIAAELEYQMKMLGSEKPSFETIVASGYRGALPHGLASSKVIKKGEMVTFDFGATYEGYVSDITRTVVVGKATSRQKRIYNLVAKAQLKAIGAAKAGMTCAKLDAVARNIITKGGFGKKFGHGLGHGIGLLVHEGPRVSPKSDYVLKPGNVITIEPGIYISKWGGVRIEDDVVIRRGGCAVLNRAPKELIEL
jgi:Xaa-Pro aminopeptidase